MRRARALAVYTALTVASTWPLAARLHVMDPGDSAFFAWILGWTLHALTGDLSSLPHANIYHPAKWALGMDEPIVGTSILALPLLPFTDDAVLMLNLVRLLTYVLSAFGVYLLCRELGTGEGASLAAGAFFAFSPLRSDQVAHLSTLGTQWLPLVFLYLHRFARSGRVRHGLLAGLFFVLAGWACGYHGMLGLVLLPPAAAVLFWGRLDRIPKGLPAAALGALGLYPLYVLHREAFDPHGFVRGFQETVFYSAGLESFLTTSPWNRLYGSLTESLRGHSGGYMFPGLVVPGLALWGGGRLWRERRWPSRDAIALLVVALGALGVALGPEIKWMGQPLFPGPYKLLRESVGIFQNIRVTSRAGMFIALVLAVLAGRSLDALRRRPQLAGALVLAALAETVIAPIPLASWAQVVDTRKPAPEVYGWLARQPGEIAIVELPIVPSDGYFRQPAFDETIYMIRSTLHWKRLVNGYAGVEPEAYRKARELAQRFPTREFLDHMRALDVRYVVLHRRGFGPNKTARIERELPAFLADGQLTETARFGDDVVYALGPAPAP